jgi:hypothetical protein
MRHEAGRADALLPRAASAKFARAAVLGGPRPGAMVNLDQGVDALNAQNQARSRGRGAARRGARMRLAARRDAQRRTCRATRPRRRALALPAARECSNNRGRSGSGSLHARPLTRACLFVLPRAFSPARDAPQARSENSFGSKVRRLVFSDANFLDDAQARWRRGRGAAPEAQAALCVGMRAATPL